MKKNKILMSMIAFIGLCISACGTSGSLNPFNSSSKQETSSDSEIQSSSSSLNDQSSSSFLPSSSSSSIEESSSASKSPSSSSSLMASSSSESPNSSSFASSSSSYYQSSSEEYSSNSISSSSYSNASSSYSASSSSHTPISSSNQPSSSSSSKPSSSSQAPSSSSSNMSSSSSSSPQKVSFDIFAINDMHGNVKDTAGKGLGIAKSTTALKELSKDKNSVFISQGDMWQGSVESNYTRGKLVTEWMNYLDFVSMTVGNHEYDWGQQYIASNNQLATFPFLGINVLYKSNNQRVDYLSPSVTFNRGAAKIGVIGAIGNCITSISSSYVQDVYFAKEEQLSNLVKAESLRLRNEENCDFIIYSIHGSGDRDAKDSYDISLSNDHYVDIVLEGHSHEKYCYSDTAGVYHIQAGANNEGLYQIPVNLDLTNHTSLISTPTYIDLSYSSSPYKNYQEDAQVNNLFTKYYDDYALGYENLGYNSYWRSSSELKQKVADLYLEEGLKKWGANYNIVLGGGYISCRGSGLAVGDVMYAQLNELFPFDNGIELCSIKGSDFKGTSYTKFDNANYYMTWTDYGNSILYNIDDNATYYMVTDKYGSDYAPNHLTVVDTLKPNYYARDVLADYIRAGNYDDRVPITGHAGTIDDPKTIAEALEYAASHTGSNVNDSGAEGAYYTGVVSRASNRYSTSTGDLGNVYVKDPDSDNEIMIYWLKRNNDLEHYSNWSSVDDLKVGDVLLFWGRPYNYKGTTLEFANDTYVVSINGNTTLC